MHNDNLHSDIQFEFENVLTGLKCLRSCIYEHVSLKTKSFEIVDKITEF